MSGILRLLNGRTSHEKETIVPRRSKTTVTLVGL